MELTLTGASLNGSSSTPPSTPGGGGGVGSGLVRRQASSASSSGKPTPPASTTTSSSTMKKSTKEKDYEDEPSSSSTTATNTAAINVATTHTHNHFHSHTHDHSHNHSHNHPLTHSHTQPPSNTPHTQCCAKPPPRAFSQPIIQDVQTLVKNKRARFMALCATIKVGTYDAFIQILDAIEEKEGREVRERECGLMGEDGHTLGHWASKRADDIRFIEYLSKIPNINLHTPSQDSVGMRPIHWAATEGSIPIIALLLRHLEDHPSSSSSTPPSSSTTTNSISPLYADPSERITNVQNELTAPPNNNDPINTRDKSGCTPLLIASQYGHADCAAFLIKRGADVQSVDDSRDSALHWAAYKGSVPVCGLLLHLVGIRGYLDVQDAFGQTPLHLAALRGNKEVVRYFMDEAEAFSVSKKSGAVMGGGLKGFPAYLLTLMDKDSKTPLDLAIKKKKGNVEVLLKEYMEQHCSTSNVSASTLYKVKRACKTLCSMEAWKIWMGLTPDAARGIEAPRFPFYITIFAALATLGMYPIYYMPMGVDSAGYLWDKTGLHMFFFGCYIMFLYSLWGVYSTDPGLLGGGGANLNGASDNDNSVVKVKMERITRGLREEYDATLESYAKSDGGGVGGSGGGVDTKDKADTPLCHSCHIAKPLRSKHCRVLRRCVLLFDHFCPFVGTTIGLYNYKYFYLFLLFGTLGQTTQLITWILYLHRSPKFPWLGFVCGFFVSFFIIPLASMLVYHTQLTAKNLTTNEHINVWKYKYLQDESGRYSNPFDRGFLKNFASRFDPGEDSYVLPRRSPSSTALVESCCGGCDSDAGKKDEERRDLLQNIV